MKYLVPFAVTAILLLQLTGSVPQSSVGGAMTLALVFLIAALAVGVHEAWSKQRGVLGWMVSIVVALTGAFLAAGLGSILMEKMLMLSNFEGSLAGTRHPMLYVVSAAMMLVTLLGSWTALWIVNRVR